MKLRGLWCVAVVAACTGGSGPPSTEEPSDPQIIELTCDGANDGPAIQAAVRQLSAAGGGVLALAPGTCILNGTIKSARVPITFRGAGRDSTILQWTTDVHGLTVTGDGSVIRDLTIRGVSGDLPGSGFGINSGNALNLTVRDCTIEAWPGGGLNTGGGGSAWLIADNIVRHNYADGIYIADGTSHSTVSGNLVEGNGANGIDINGSANLIVDNTVTANGLRHPIHTADTWGILIQAIGAQGVHADSNVVRGNAVYGQAHGPGIAIRGDGSFHANFNVVDSNQTYENETGIQVDGSATGPIEGTLVIGNTATNNARAGIAVATGNSTPIGTRIANNVATGNETGIYLDHPVETTMIDNTLAGNEIPVTDLGSVGTVRSGNLLTSGPNALLSGRAVLSRGMAVVGTTEVQPDDNILLNAPSDSVPAGLVRVGSIEPGTNFTIQSTSGADTLTILWQIVH